MKWLGKLYHGAKRFIGKVASGVQTASKMYGKAKDTYNNIKNTVSTLPVIGATASHLFNKGEEYVNDKLKNKTGVDFKDIDRVHNVIK